MSAAPVPSLLSARERPGILQFFSTGSFTLTVSGNITVNNGAKLWYNSNNTRSHTLNLAGNLINNGTVSFYYDSNDLVNMTFNGASNSVVSGSGTWVLHNVTMLKSSSSYSLEIQATGFEAAISILATTDGTYIHNNSSGYSINSASSTDYTINSNTSFKVPQGTLTFSQSANNLYLQGSLYVDGGAVYVGSTAGTGGIFYDASNGPIPYLEVSSGHLTVYGGVLYKSSGDAFDFYMSGGTMLLNSGTSGVSSDVFNVNDVAYSSFTMSGGTLIIQNPNGVNGNNHVDFTICANNGAVTSTGGTVQFGNNSTPSGSNFDFDPFPYVVMPNFEVTGLPTASITLSASKNSSNDFQLLSLYIDTLKTFDIRSIQGAGGDSKMMTLTSTYDGTYAMYNKGIFDARTGNVTMAGNNPQSVGGTSLITFYDFTMNSSGNATLLAAESVSDLLTMTAGILYTTSMDVLTCTSSASATIGNSSSYVDGPMIHTVAASSQQVKIYPIGKGASYRPAVLTVTHSNSTSVTYQGEVINSSAMALGYNLPATLAKVSYTRYWNFSRQNVANFSSATMKLYYDTDDSVTNSANLRVAHDDGSSNWVNYGGTGSANTTGSITSTTISSFHSKFALAFPPGSLPIELVSFTANNDGNTVAFECSTASEINNNYFTIERSADGISV